MRHWKTARFRQHGGASGRPRPGRGSVVLDGGRSTRESADVEVAQRRLERQVRERDAFLAGLSHELRTPLNAIIGFAEVLASDVLPLDSPRRLRFLANILGSARHLLQLMNDVLDLSRVEAGMATFQVETVDLGRLVAQVTDVLHSRLLRKTVTVATEIPASLASVHVDSGRLKRVLMTFLANAIDHSSPGDTIVVRAGLEPGHCFRLEVEDHGPGISRGQQARAFCEIPEGEGRPAATPDHSGMNLALARRVIRAQGGRVGTRDTPGGGVTYFLVLARGRAEASQEASTSRLREDVLSPVAADDPRS